jgi:hypothetical protein
MTRMKLLGVEEIKRKHFAMDRNRLLLSSMSALLSDF